MTVILEAAKLYTSKGWVVHPLSSPRDTGNSPGKRPLLKGWQKLKINKDTDNKIAEWFSGTDSNIGLVCGKESNVIVIDMDKLDWSGVIFPVEQMLLDNTLRAGRTTGRGHIYFKYTDEIKAQKLHDFGVEVLSDGNNAVMPPSKHQSGELYKWRAPEGADVATFELGDVPKIVIKNIGLLKSFGEKVKSCRQCMKWVIHQSNDVMHGHEGRRLMLCVSTELKANGVTLDEMRLYARKVYGDDYDSQKTQQEWRNVDSGKTWKCDTIRDNFPILGKLCSLCPIKTLDKDYIDIEYTKKAIEIMTTGNPVQFIIDTWNKFHSGDSPFGYVLLCSAVCGSVEASDGLPINFNGDSGGGKSHSCRSMLHLMLPKHWIRRSLSNKALFYSASIQSDMIFFSDDVEMSEEMKAIFKNSVSDFQEQIEHETVDMHRRAQILRAPPRLTWWLTAVTDIGDAQMERRCLKIAIEVTDDRKKVISDRFLQRKKKGEHKYPEFSDVMICRAIFKELKSKIETVVFDFDIIFRHDADINTQSIVYELLCATALINKYQRQRTEHGAIIATKEDFQFVIDMFSKVSDTQVTKLTRPELLVVRYLHKVKSASSNKIQTALMKSKTWVSFVLNGRDGKGGLLSKMSQVVEYDITIKDDTDLTRKKEYHFVGDWDPLSVYTKIAEIKQQ